MTLETESEVVLKILCLRLRNFCFIRRATEGRSRAGIKEGHSGLYVANRL